MTPVLPLPLMHPNQTPNLHLVLYAPDNRHMARLGATLSGHARLNWVDSREVGAPQLAGIATGASLVLLDYCGGNASYSTGLARQLAATGCPLPMVGVGTDGPEQAQHLLGAVRAGVRDFVDIDDDAAQFLEVITRVSAQAAPAAPLATPPAAAPEAASGRLVLLHGVRPGIGTTLLAVHLAAQLAARDAGAAPRALHPTLLLDLGSPGGDGALYLGIDTHFSYEEALRNVERIDATFASTALGHHASGLALLGLAGAGVPAAHEPAALLKQLRAIFPLVLADTGGVSTPHLPDALLEQAHEIWLVVDQGIGALVSLDQCIRELEQRGLRDERLRLVVNRYDPEGGLGDRQIAERFALPLLATLPERSRMLRSSTGRGRLLSESAPRDPYVRALQPLVRHLAGGRESPSRHPLARLASLLGR
ncbi:AAA family ATPase [Stenotrophomonas mori]|uniref:Fimbrial protein n=1 Tax=Stenotrophomonas mori TaxID=2871096 RepID=A0ABT0SEG2_9GAMM|nr:fimbrial protein [Stenotrophomonas mori]MCL7713511.1 fimbrial protein [Stenotrophomonas mori]